jgi:hypothetical protein
MHRRAATLLSALAALGPTACTAEDPGGPAVPSSAAFLPDDEPAATDAPRPADTDVVLSFALWEEGAGVLDAAGYASPVVEEGGTCTLELTGDGGSLVVTASGRPDASTTVCAGLSVPGNELAAGTWTLRLHYSSPTAEGTSEPLTVEVPA